MGFRYKKQIKIAPGLKLNISKSGISTSVGGRGASLNFGRNGVKGTVGIPGSGLSYSKNLSYNSSNKKNTQPLNIPNNVLIQLDDEGNVFFTDENGNRVDQKVNTILKKEYQEEIKHFLEEKVREINVISESIKEIRNLILPDGKKLNNYERRIFRTETLNLPLPSYQEFYNEIKWKKEQQADFFTKTFAKQKLEEEIRIEAETEYQRLQQIVQQKQWEFYTEQNQKRFSFEQMENKRLAAIQGDIPSIEDYILEGLQHLNAPLKFSGSLQAPVSTGVVVEIDLPEIEEIPTYKASISKSNKISMKNKSQREIKQEYAEIVSGIALIVASFIFHELPNINQIVLSGYTQRIDITTGIVKDDYIYSLNLFRNNFYSINYSQVDLIMSLSNFEPIWNLSKSFDWKTIQPYYVE